MKKPDQQSRSGWGGKRAGAGAPLGNINAVKDGVRSRRAFFPLVGEEQLTPLVALRARNLILAEHIGSMIQEGRYCSGDRADWREQMFIEGMWCQHIDRIIRLEIKDSIAKLNQAKEELKKTKAILRVAKTKGKARPHP